MSQMNGMVIQKLLDLLEFWLDESIIKKIKNVSNEWNGYPDPEISRQYLLLQTVILQKKVIACPWNETLAHNPVLFYPI